MLIDACRSVGIPARLVGIPKWANKPGNHTWVEIWDGGWHFTGACEHDPQGLDRAWFAADAALAKKDSVESAIYASSFKRTRTTFPLVWSPENKDVFAENVTDRYAPPRKATLPDDQRQRIVQAASDFFAKGTLPEASLDDVLRQNETEVRRAAWQAYAASNRHSELRADFDKRQVRHEKHLSRYTVKSVGKKPEGGWPLFIALHGGGGVPAAINDSQWQIMQRYYRDQDGVPGYLYVALRAPNDLWNGFYDAYMLPLTIHLIRQFTLFGEVDANKVFLMGYSHGGYGAFYIGPKIPDRFAAIHASAAAPTAGTISAKCLRQTRFTFMIGENDNAYGRRDLCEKFAGEIEALRKENPDAYPVTMEFQKGFGHSDLPDRNKIKDLYPATRKPVPTHLTWVPTDGEVRDFYWLSLAKPTPGQFVDVKAAGNTLTVRTEKVDRVSFWLDQRLISYEQPLEVIVNGMTSRHKVTPSFRKLCESIANRGDLDLAASARVDVVP